MASGYITSDGKDLDARYLGINSKAASAKVADTATTATVATRLNQGFVVKNGGVIQGDLSETELYTVPKSGLLVGYTNFAIHDQNGDNIGYTTREGVFAYVNAGDKIKRSGWESGRFGLFPLKV